LCAVGVPPSPQDRVRQDLRLWDGWRSLKLTLSARAYDIERVVGHPESERL
jgi:hypothetical protein